MSWVLGGCKSETARVKKLVIDYDLWVSDVTRCWSRLSKEPSMLILVLAHSQLHEVVDNILMSFFVL